MSDEEKPSREVIFSELGRRCTRCKKDLTNIDFLTFAKRIQGQPLSTTYIFCMDCVAKGENVHRSDVHGGLVNYSRIWFFPSPKPVCLPRSTESTEGETVVCPV